MSSPRCYVFDTPTAANVLSRSGTAARKAAADVGAAGRVISPGERQSGRAVRRLRRHHLQSRARRREVHDDILGRCIRSIDGDVWVLAEIEEALALRTHLGRTRWIVGLIER